MRAAGPAALVAAAYLSAGFTPGNVVEPRLMGRKPGQSTVVVFLSVVFWGALVGPEKPTRRIPLVQGMAKCCKRVKEWLQQQTERVLG